MQGRLGAKAQQKAQDRREDVKIGPIKLALFDR